MNNLWYLLVGFLLGSSHDSKSSRNKVDYSPETIRIVMMINSYCNNISYNNVKNFT